MRVEKLGKRQYAFGLEWLEVPDGQKPAATVGEALDGDAKGVMYATVASAEDGGTVVGYGRPDGKVSGAVYSYAGALAKAGRDGIFVAPADGGRYWFAAVRSGVVVPGTDRAGDAAEIVRDAGSLRTATQLQLYAAAGVSMEEEQFDPVRAIESVRKLPRLRSASASWQTAMVALMMLAVFGGVGYGTYTTLFPSHPVGQTQAQKEEVARQAWLTKVAGATASMAVDGDWAQEAVGNVLGSYPPMVGGWVAEGTSCGPSSCDVQYVLPVDTVSAVTPLRERFGAALSAPSGNGRTMTAHFPLHGALHVLTLDALRNIATAPALLGDMTGLLTITLPHVDLDKPPVVTVLPGAPTGYRTLRVEAVSIKGDQADAGSMRLAIAYWTRGGFVPTKLAWSNGWGAVPAAWHVELVRLSAEG